MKVSNVPLLIRSYHRRFEAFRENNLALQQVAKAVGLFFLVSSLLFFLVHLCGIVVAGLVLLWTLEKIWGLKIRDPWANF